MGFKIIHEDLNGLMVIKPDIYKDERGLFMEIFREDRFEELGLPTNFVQDSHSSSIKNVLRGLHFQWSPPTGKLIRATQGSAYLAAVDIRKKSSTFRKWYGLEISKENNLQLWAPAGFASGFCVLSDYAEIQYKCTGIYNPKGESEIIWNDQSLGINWPVKNPILSEKDKNAHTLEQWLGREESNNFKIS